MLAQLNDNTKGPSFIPSSTEHNNNIKSNSISAVVFSRHPLNVRMPILANIEHSNDIG